METQGAVYDACRNYISDLADTVSFKTIVLGFLRARDLKSLCSCSQLLSEHCHDAESQRALLQIEAFFKKNELFSEASRCLDAAKDSFIKAELQCTLTNKRLEHFYLHQDRLDPDMKLVIQRAREWIRSTLGPLENLISQIPERVRVTAGATADQSRRKSQPHLKVRRGIEVTNRGVPYVEALLSFFKLGKPRCKVRYHNRVEFVPKNWKTYRTIACEPTGCIPFQLAFDGFVKDRLRKRGIDLSNQSKNQELARQGSIDGSFATIDLSAASDTVSLNACAWLFPSDWLSFMKDFRSPLYKHPVTGKTTSYSKFSSMGNGMTFCIETLIFASLVRAVGSKRGIVYGDDICIETEHAQSLFSALKFFGFKVNQEKSYVSGSYRESCGTHWFKGTLITPFFVRGNVRLKPFVSHNVNGLVKVSLPEGNLWRLLRTICRSHNLLIVPPSEDTTSGVFIDTEVALRTKRLVQRDWIFFYSRYEFRKDTVVADDIRSLLLWYHDSFRVQLPDNGDLSRARQRSRYYLPLERYRRRRAV